MFLKFQKRFLLKSFFNLRAIFCSKNLPVVTAKKYSPKSFFFAGQSFLNYAFLCIIFTSWLALKSGDRGLIAVFKKRGWKYFFLAVIDVEANYLVVKAFQYTSLTSIQVSGDT